MLIREEVGLSIDFKFIFSSDIYLKFGFESIIECIIDILNYTLNVSIFLN